MNDLDEPLLTGMAQVLPSLVIIQEIRMDQWGSKKF